MPEAQTAAQACDLETQDGRLQAVEYLTERIRAATDITALKGAMLDLCDVMRMEMVAAL